MRNKALLIFLNISLLAIISCQQTDRLIDENVVFENQVWEQDKKVSFDFEIKDSDQEYNFNLNLRNSIEYPYRNLYFLYSIKDSIGNLVTSNQQQLLLFSKSGKPLGTPSGILGIQIGDDYYSSNQFLQYGFDKPGKYTIDVSQNMRGEEALSGVMLVGVKVTPKH